MADKFLSAVTPACIVFGPLFLTKFPGRMSELGLCMLTLGLFSMLRVIRKQEKTIHDLEHRIAAEHV